MTIRQEKRGRKSWIANARKYGGGEKSFLTQQEAVAYLEIFQSRSLDYSDPENTPFFGELYRVKAGKRLRYEAEAETAVEKYIERQERQVLLQQQGDSYKRQKEYVLHKIGKFAYNGKTVAQTRMGYFTSPDLERQILDVLFLSDQSYKTSKEHWFVITAFFGAAKSFGWLTYNPADIKIPQRRPDQKAPPKPKIKPDEINEVIAATAPPYQLVMTVAAYTGLRAGEIVALQWDKVFLDNTSDSGKPQAYVQVDRARKKDGTIGSPKTENGIRAVYLSQDLAGKLREWKFAQPIKQRHKNFVFPNAEGNAADSGKWRKSGLYPAIERVNAKRRAEGRPELPKHSWKAMRNYFASIVLYQLRLHDDEVTSLMGHHSVEFTRQQYAYLDPSVKDNQIGENLGKIQRGAA